MNYWYSLNLGDGIMAGVPSAEIEAFFQRAYISAGRPPEMAVFTRSESEGRLHCEVIVYFSPASTDVALAFQASPCARPARAGLGLLAGDENSWLLLFPEDNP